MPRHSPSGRSLILKVLPLRQRVDSAVPVWVALLDVRRIRLLDVLGPFWLLTFHCDHPPPGFGTVGGPTWRPATHAAHSRRAKAIPQAVVIARTVIACGPSFVRNQISRTKLSVSPSAIR